MTATYNGFPGDYRDRVQRTELEPRWRSGEWPRPSECDVCGQREGAIHGHLENYDRPETYVPLCITCHLTLHYRFRMDPAAWQAYRDLVRVGLRMPALTQRQAWGTLERTTFIGNLTGAQGAPNPDLPPTFLDVLPMTRSATQFVLWVPRTHEPLFTVAA